MARLPQPGSDQGTWGAILNDFLVQAHNDDGTLKAGSVTSSTITNGAVTEVKLDAATQAKLNAVASGGVASVNGRGGSVVLTKTDVDLANVDNTSDVNKPVSAFTQTALDAKANTTSVTASLAGKANTVHTHVISDVTNLQTSLDAKAASSHTHTASQISDATVTGRTLMSAADAAAARTAIGAGTGNSNLVIGTTSSTAKAGDYTPTKTDVGLANVDNTSDANKPVSTATQTALNLKANTSSLATVATSGSYADLTNKPDIGAKVLVLNQGDAVPGGTAVGTVILRRQ